VAGAHRVDRAAQAEQVGPVIDGLTAGLLRGHVVRGTGDDAALRQTRVGHRPGQPEVRDLHPLDRVLQQDVRRFDVAVHEPLGMGRGQARGRLVSDPQDLQQFEGPLAVEPVLQRAAGDVFHDQVRQSVRLLHVVYGDNVLVDDGRGGVGLAAEPLTRRTAARQHRRDHLHRHEPVQVGIECLQDDSVPTPAENAGDLVPADAAERVRIIGRGQEVERVVGRIAGLGVGGAAEVVADGAGPRLPTGQGVQAAAAGRAELEVALQLPDGGRRQAVIQ
jgi:hypothetical protein